MSIADGLKRIVRSAKVQLSATVVAGAAVALVTAPGDFASKRDLWRDFLYAGFGLIGVCVASWAYEDGKAAAGPQSQVNVQSDVKNPAPTPQDARPAPVVEPPKPEVTEKQLLLAIYQHLKAQAKQQVPPVVVQAPPAPHETSV
jgi:hypothetical protein